ncbi:MAG: 16S rRNA (uracil(1498)-N(3))-methyltransferase [Flavobacteriia bacterium]|nr:16S rRNA (uracil(1498)-N(3))-methyltransferase [Flavobacteriia bacterium]
MHSFWGYREGTQVHLDPEEVVHATKVLRLETGAEVLVFDGSGTVYTSRIESASKRHVSASILEELTEYGAVAGHLHIAIAPTKNVDRMHFFLEKAVEMGVHAVTPIWTFHSERKHWNAEKALKIMKGACTQSHKGRLPLLHSAQPLEALLKGAQEEKRYIATCLDRPKNSLVEAFAAAPMATSHSVRSKPFYEKRRKSGSSMGVFRRNSVAASISVAITRSPGTAGTLPRYAATREAMKLPESRPDCSSAETAAIHSMPRRLQIRPSTSCTCTPAMLPMLTWSSWPAELSMLSVLLG